MQINWKTRFTVKDGEKSNIESREMEQCWSKEINSHLKGK